MFMGDDAAGESAAEAPVRAEPHLITRFTRPPKGQDFSELALLSNIDVDVVTRF
jgi:hypothetical protein